MINRLPIEIANYLQWFTGEGESIRAVIPDVDVWYQQLLEYKDTLNKNPERILKLNVNYHVNVDLSPYINLTYLDCRNTVLTILPDSLNNLTHLYCSSNLLTSLPDSLNNLTHLNCSGNELTILPDNLNNLTFLDCSGNELTILPDNLNNLTYLSCFNNQLTILPDNLHNLTKLYCNFTTLRDYKILISQL
jgi:Leucine-rich repeat (LRR) protein